MSAAIVRFCKAFTFFAFLSLGVNGAQEEHSIVPLIVAIGGFVALLAIDRLLFGQRR